MGDSPQRSIGSNSSTCSENSRRESIGSVSLNNELAKIGSMLPVLKKLNPEKRKPGLRKKPSQNTSFNVDLNGKMINIVESIFNTTTKMMGRITSLEESNVLLRNQVDELSNGRSYAEVAAQPPSGTINKSSSDGAHPVISGLGGSLMVNVDDRLDALEQESLASVLSCQGDAIDSLIERVNHQGGSNRDQITAIKEALLNELNTIADNPIHEDGIINISLHGRNKKHLKVVCVSKHVKSNIVRTVKKSKPPNFFADDYLTRRRSALLFKLRTMKRNNDRVTAVYCRGGTLFCKTVSNGKPIQINSEGDIIRVEDQLRQGDGSAGSIATADAASAGVHLLNATSN
jgi:hypothetical protein